MYTGMNTMLALSFYSEHIFCIILLLSLEMLLSCDMMMFGDKVAQLVRCRTSNQRVAGLIPGHPVHFGRSWAKQLIPYCFSLPSCKMGT